MDRGGRDEIPPPEDKEELPSPEPKKGIAHEERKGLDDKVRELQERLLRVQAEFENYKKRAEREREAHREHSSADFILKILPVVDEFEIALSHMERSHAKEFKHGMELIYAKLRETLKKEGAEEMKALGESFDPYKHDAIRQGDGEEGKVVEVIVKGYNFRGKVLRHAKVVVGNGKEADKHGKEGA